MPKRERMEDDPRVTCMDILDPRAQVCPGVGLLHVHILVPSTFDWSFSDDTCACVCIVAGAGDQGIANVATAFRRAGRLFMLCWVAVFSRLFMLLDFVCVFILLLQGATWGKRKRFGETRPQAKIFHRAPLDYT